MNVTPRIIGLAEGGFDPLTISHMLGITFEQVDEGLRGLTVNVESGGGGIPTNWGRIEIKSPELTDTTPFNGYKPADLEIFRQAGDDLTIGEYEEEGAILSTAGGLYYVEIEISPALIASEEHGLRVALLEVLVGNSPPPPSINIDLEVLAFWTTPAAQLNAFQAGTLGYVPPGGPVISNVTKQFQHMLAGDTIKAETDFARIVQVGVPA